MKTAPYPIPVYRDGKIVAHVTNGEWVAEPKRVPADQRKLYYRSRKEEASVTCYFIGGSEGPVKIGFTKHLERRLRAFQHYSPVPLFVLATTGGGIFSEREYHERFASSRLHGEWFERTPELLALIERLNQTQEIG